MTKIINTNFSVLGETTLLVDNATGEFLTIDAAGVVRKRIANEVLTDIGAAPIDHIHNYIHDQSIPSTIWSFNHGLGKRASVIVVDTAGTVVTGQIDYIDDNNITINFNGAFSGYAYIN